MHIQCKDTAEFLELMRACEYLHNLHGKQDLDTEKHPIINLIRHLYLGSADMPDKQKFVSINGRKTLPERDATHWGTI
jgi:hypothetical protein